MGYEFRRQDFYSGLIIIAISLFVVVESWQMPRHFQGWPVYAAPGIVTGLLGLGLFGMGFTLTIRSIRRQGTPLAFKRSDILSYLKDPKTHRLGLMFALSLIYCLFLGHRLFYIVVTAIYLAIAIITFRGTSPFKAIMISVTVAVGVALVFNRLFLIPLP
jgi:predicted small integral membrane protein